MTRGKRPPSSNGVSRISRVNELIKREIGTILLRELDLPEGVFVTVMRVEAFPNLQGAKVYISIIPEEKGTEVFRTLQKDIYNIQQILNKRLNMRPVPRIQWVKDAVPSEAQRIEELFEKIKRK